MKVWISVEHPSEDFERQLAVIDGVPNHLSIDQLLDMALAMCRAAGDWGVKTGTIPVVKKGDA